jgi:MFS family permease
VIGAAPRADSTSDPSALPPGVPWAALTLLAGINAVNFFDRQVLSAVTEPLRSDWSLSDTQIGWLGTAFTLLYAAAGIPLGKLADVWSRRKLLVAGLWTWSGLTFLSGLSQSFAALFVARLGVGAGEAVCAPAATSMIGDLVVPERRGRAMSVFMLGLPVGLALSYAVSGVIALRAGWRYAFFVAGVPGMLLAIAASTLREPARGQTESVGRAHGSRGAVGLLKIPTMLWIALSGAVHNFSMYAFSSFLPAFLMRYHGVDVQDAGLASALIIGIMGGMGSLTGGWLGDRAGQRWAGGRLAFAACAGALSVPAALIGLGQPSGSVGLFIATQGFSVVMLYAYYPTVYASIQDIVEPSRRGIAMALYFFAMYALGASLGPVGAGWLSDTFSVRAAKAAGTFTTPGAIPEAFRAAGLHSAMYVLPVGSLLLAITLGLAARTLPRDSVRMRERMSRTPSVSES